jgi:autotransporter-associated beta strand protein
MASAAALAQNPAFPGAEGFGANSLSFTPGVQYDVYRVIRLDDAMEPGTLRHAVRESGFPAAGRIVVFDVGGTINLTSSLDIKNVKNLYIAGQTAPSPITIYNESGKITSSNNKVTQNIVMRYLTFRKGTGNGSDAFGFEGSGTGTNLMLDHVSASWSEDEVLSVANNNTNVTVQYSIISDALVNNHAYGSLVRPRIDSNVTFHHNLYANNASRNPRAGTYDGHLLNFDFVNNVIYNSRDRNGYAGGSSESNREFVDMNYVGNYVIAGPGTIANQNRAFLIDKNVSVRAYQQGNLIDSDKQLNPGGQPNGADTGWNMFQVIAPIIPQGTLEQMATRFNMPQVLTQSANDAYWQVINHAGSFWWDRDAIDARVVNNVLTNTGPQIGAAAPIASELNAVLNAPITSRPVNWDTDGDGMPDYWEVLHGLNPAVKDHHLDFDNNGYSNLEQYINELGAFPAPRPITWTGGNNRYALNGNWDTWQPSRFDTVVINTGKATVDAVGQHAGTIRIGSQAGANGELEVTNGWLNAAATVHVGGAGTGRLRLSGGSLLVGQDLNLNTNGTIFLSGGTLSLSTTGAFNWNGGTLTTTVDQSIGMNATLGATGGTLDTTDRNIHYTGNLSGGGRLTKTGTGTLTLSGNNGSGVSFAVNAGTLRFANHQSTSGLTIGSTATVDVTTKLIDIHYTGDSPFAALQQAVLNGANNTAGAKIITTGGLAGRTVGIHDDGTRIRVGYAAHGDSDLDGAVTMTDMSYLVADGFTGSPKSNTTWTTGDWDHDGSTTISDVNLVVAQVLINTGPYPRNSNSSNSPQLIVNLITGAATLDTNGQSLAGYQIQSRGSNGVITAAGDGDGYLTAGLAAVGSFSFTNSTRDEFAAALGSLNDGVYELEQLYDPNLVSMPLSELFVLSDLRFAFNGDNSAAGNGVITFVVPEPSSIVALLGALLLTLRRRSREAILT